MFKSILSKKFEDTKVVLRNLKWTNRQENKQKHYTKNPKIERWSDTKKLRGAEDVSSSCSTIGTRHVTLVTNLMINNERLM